MHAGVPQLCVDFPVYRDIIREYPFALLIDDTSSESIAKHINDLLNDRDLYARMAGACIEARKKLNWQHEERELLSFYQRIKDARNQ
jgi:glycosyltransferase involved in cell wall biosynthesis